MVARVIPGAVVAVVTVLTLAGCGRHASKETSLNLDTLALGPERQVLPLTRPSVSEAIDAAGGLTAWKQCTKIQANATVKASARDGAYYLTEQNFVICPWSDAIQVTAHEPWADFVWGIVGGQYYAPQVNGALDVSPLANERSEYAEAVLRIVTAPVRMLDEGVVLTPRPAAVQIDGQWYLPVDVTYRTAAGENKERDSAAGSEQVRWTKSTYFQNQSRPVVDMIWLGDPDAQKYLLVRGYDYTRKEAGGVLIPATIEVFQSDADANFGPRLARISLEQ